MRNWKRSLFLLVFLSLLTIPMSVRADFGTGWNDDCRMNVHEDDSANLIIGKHNWVESGRTPATCTENGTILYSCSYCGASQAQPIPAAGHSWGGWAVTAAPTCVEAGSQTRTCSVCGASETQAVPATGSHSWGDWTVTTAPTCAAAGTQTHTCTVCGTSETQGIPATGNHSWGSWTQTKAAGCTAGGEETHTCTVCGASETRATSALGHNWGKWSVKKAATCTSTGLEKRTCSRCGESESREIAKTAHRWGSWRTIRAATCDKTGEEERSCSVCGQRETREIQKLPHTYGEWEVKKESTCTETGKRTHTCKVCGYEETEDIAMLPHDFGEWTVTKEPTCTETGAHVHTCRVCGFEETEEMEMIPHDFDEWVVISPLTDFSVGIRERTCKVCGFLEHEERVPAGTRRNGDRGDGVRQLQQALNDAGYDAGAVDGAFGPKTEGALKDAQEDLKKEPDGVGWPGFLKILLNGKELPENLILSVKLTSEPDWYGEGETAAFEAKLTNVSGKDLTDFTIYQRSENAEETSEWAGIFEYNGSLAAGESVTIPNLSYTVSAKDAAQGHVLVSFYVSAEADETLYSNQEDLGLVTEAPGPEIELTADKVVVMPFSKDAEFTVPLTLVSYSTSPVLFEGLSAGGGYSGDISSESWMTQPLEAGVEYHFTYTDKLRAWEADETWVYRLLEAVAKDPETGKTGYAFTHAFATAQVNGPSVMLLADDTTGMGGDVGDEVCLPLYAVNNGTSDLKVSEIRDLYETDYADYDHAYDTLFAAGDSFPVDFTVKVLPQDALYAGTNGASFWRNVILQADLPDGTGSAADDELVTMWFSGPLPGLSLMVGQTTPAQETWSPDESGQIADIEYDCIAKNTGERSLVLDSLYVYMYPSTEAADALLKIENVVLEPGETYNFTATLPIGTGNIFPGSASETIDGVIEAEFMVTGLDPVSMQQIAWSQPADNAFSYKVKLNEYAWTPPSSGGEEQPEPAAAEDADAQKEQDASLFVTKSVTSRAQIQTKPTESGDFYAEGEEVTYEIDLYNFSSETLYDLEVIDRIGGAETVVTTISSLAPGEEQHVSYSYHVNLSDAQSYVIQNTAWATYRVGESDERVRSYEDSAFINVIDIPVGDGSLSEDLELKKSAAGSPSASNGFYAEGDVVHYSVQVINNSDHSIENITVTDPLSGSGSIGTISALAPGESDTVGFDYEVTAADVGKEKIKNVARAEWTGENGKQFANSNVNYVSTAAPALEIVKYVANSPEMAGGFREDEIIRYEITVTNTSQAQMTNLEVMDYRKPGDPLVGVIADLNPGESASVGFDYAVTKADTEAGEVVNQAGVELHRNNNSAMTEQYVKSNELHTPTLHSPADVTVMKSEETGSPDPAGYALHETSQGLITVTNSSDQPLTNVDIYDMANGDSAGIYMGTISQIDPGESKSIPWGLTVLPEDVERGHMTNAGRAEFTDPYTGESRVEYASEITIKVKQPDTVYGGLSVIKSISGAPANGSFYVEGEEITFRLDVTNNSGETLESVTVYEAMVSGGILLTVSDLKDGESLTDLSFTYTVTEPDVINGEVNNVATVHAIGVGGNKYIALSNPAIAPTGKTEGGSGHVTMEKTEVSSPANGSFYTEGETIEYEISVTNDGMETVSGITVRDLLAPDGGEIGAIASLTSGEIQKLSFTYTVTPEDVASGKVLNRAWAKWSSGESASALVVSLAGLDMSASETGFTLTGTKEGTAGDLEDPEGAAKPGEGPAGGTTNPGGTVNYSTVNYGASVHVGSVSGGSSFFGSYGSAGAAGSADASGADSEPFCIRALTGKGEGTEAFALSYCAEHMEVAEEVKDLLEQAEDEKEQLAALQQSIDLWTEALNAEYDALMEEKTDLEKAILLRERTLFSIQLTCRWDSLTSRYPKDPMKVAMAISEQLMNKTVDLCYELHAAPDARPDSVITGIYTGLAEMDPEERCLRDVTQTDTGAAYLENLCEAHRITETAIDALLYDAADAQAQADAWQSAGQLWLVELDAIINERYLAADEEGRPVIAAERVSFGNWLKERESMLKLLYPGNPEIVNEVIAQTIRARVLDLCTEE